MTEIATYSSKGTICPTPPLEEGFVSRNPPKSVIQSSKPVSAPAAATAPAVAPAAAPTKAKPLTCAKPLTYDNFLKAHYYDKSTNTNPLAEITNTRIGTKTKGGGGGGTWYIPPEDYEEFLRLYYTSILSKPDKKEYFTESQLAEGGPILIDIDLRYAYDTQTRQYTDSHIAEMVDQCVQILSEIYQLDDTSDPFRIYLLEKPRVNVVEKDRLVKDGLHIIVGIRSSPTVQKYMRERMIDRITDETSTPLLWKTISITNSWEDVFDSGISGGKTNWQLYGSRKPDHDAYVLTHVYEIVGGCRVQSIPLEECPIEQNLKYLSARYADHPEFFHTTAYLLRQQYENSGSGSGPVAGAGAGLANRAGAVTGAGAAAADNHLSSLIYQQITSKEHLDLFVQKFLLNCEDYEWVDIYHYTMALPESYYGNGSYDKWFRVGCTLKNHHPDLFIIWFAFSSQSPTFDWTHGGEELLEKWNNMNHKDRLTIRSIKFWCKQDNPTRYQEIYEDSADQMIEQSLNKMDGLKGIKGYSHSDVAQIMYRLYKDEFVCASVKSGEWYRFVDNRWRKTENGTELRQIISGELRAIYGRKHNRLEDYILELQRAGEENEKKINSMLSRLEKVIDIEFKLGDSNMKDNIMKESREIFYNPMFRDKLDTNRDLLCVKNGVLDFKQGVFRRGNPEDYLSLCTQIEYIPIQRKGVPSDYYTQSSSVPYVPMSKQLDFRGMDAARSWLELLETEKYQDSDDEIVDNIYDFMNKIFTNESLREYMWQHLASSLLGYTSQTFNMYIGKGSNGKSVLTKLMSDILGEYKGDVPLTLITEKRQKIGGLAPEIVDLKGVRFALIQESSKGDVLNEGIMKQLTSGIDVIQGRGLFQSSATKFYPQFELVICSNEMLEIRSQDGGTWRRVRKIEFESKFTDNPDPNNPKEFKKISEIEMNHRMNARWKSMFLSMLVDVAFKMRGRVDPCSVVEAASRSYQESLDFMSGFLNDCVEVVAEGKIEKRELKERFERWFRENNGGKEPKIKEVNQYMDNKYGKCVKNCWKGVQLKEDEEDVEPPEW